MKYVKAASSVRLSTLERRTNMEFWKDFMKQLLVLSIGMIIMAAFIFVLSHVV
jgi:hypothetical protein|tara:strand:+ start:98 stop:256 length:159 start_codon:yes stop_codon:yes gene_type:complete